MALTHTFSKGSNGFLEHTIKTQDRGEAKAALAAIDLRDVVADFLECGPNAGHNCDLITRAQAALEKATTVNLQGPVAVARGPRMGP